MQAGLDFDYDVQKSYKPIRGLVQTKEDFEEMMKDLWANEHIAIDTETTGLDYFKDRIIGFVFGTKDNEYYVPFRHKVGALQLDIEYIKPDIKRLLASNKKKLFFNAKFDIRMLLNDGIETSIPYYDTQVMLHLLDERRPLSELSLKKATREFLGRNPLNLSDVAPYSKVLTYVELEKAFDYAAADGRNTYDLYFLFKDMLIKDELFDYFERVESPLIPVLMGMEIEGIKVDVDYLKDMSISLAVEIEKYEKQAADLVGNVNLASPQQLQELLYNKLGLECKVFNATKQPDGSIKNNPSTDDVALEALKGEHPIIELIQNFRKYSKLKNTYADAVLNAVDKNNRVHTNFNQVRVSTGRLSSSNPVNLQNQVRSDFMADGKTYNMRKAYIAEEGYSLLCSDQSSLEVRLVTGLSKDENLIKAYAEGLDTHKLAASKIFGVSYDEVDDDLRYKSKTLGFGIIYGMEKYGLAKSLGVSDKEAENIINAYFKSYKGLHNFIKSTHTQVKKNCFSKELFGRKRRFPEIVDGTKKQKQKALKEALNFQVQGLAASIMKLIMIRLNKEIKQCNIDMKILLQIHDEIVCEVRNDQIEGGAKLLKYVMENTVQPFDCVKLQADVGIGNDWKGAK